MKQVNKTQNEINIDIMNLYAQLWDSEWLDFTYGMGLKINRSVDCEVKDLLTKMFRNHNKKNGPNLDTLDEQMNDLMYLIGEN